MPIANHTVKITNWTHLVGPEYVLSVSGNDPVGGGARSVRLQIPVRSLIEVDLIYVQFDQLLIDTLCGWIDEGLAEIQIDNVVQSSVQFSSYKYGGALTGGVIDIMFNGVSLGPNLTALNFVNAQDPAGYNGVMAQVNDPLLNPTQIDAYIHPPGFVSHFNTSDGSTNASVSNWPTFNRYVSAPGTFDILGWAAGSAYNGFHQTPGGAGGPVTYALAGNFSILANDGTTVLTVTVLSADGTDLGTHVVPIGAGPYSATVNNVTIIHGLLTPDSYKFQASLSISVLIDNMIPQGGKYSISIVHNNGVDGIFSYNSGNMFHDPNSTAATIANPTIAENTPVVKWLSGIQYYNLGSTFDIGIPDIDNINAESYPQPFINVDCVEYGITNFNLNGGDLTAWTSAWNDINSSYSGTHAITAANYRFIGTDANIDGRWVDWVNGAWQPSPDAAICIDTYATESTALAEYFTDEARRRTEFDLAGAYNAGAAWDSTQDMGAYDDNIGLLIQSGLIRTRHTDWNSYAPGMAANPDYMGFAGWGTYYRRFTDVSSSDRGSARLTFAGDPGIVNAIIAGTIRLYVFIPDTTWRVRAQVHGAALFDFATFDANIQNGGTYSDVVTIPNRTSANNGAGTLDISFGNLHMGAGHNELDIQLEMTSGSPTISSIILSW